MNKIVMVFILLFSVSITVFTNDAQDASLLKYDNLFRDRKYELIVKDLVTAIAANGEGEESFIPFATGEDIIHARNLVADSYRMLKNILKQQTGMMGLMRAILIVMLTIVLE